MPTPRGPSPSTSRTPRRWLRCPRACRRWRRSRPRAVQRRTARMPRPRTRPACRLNLPRLRQRCRSRSCGPSTSPAPRSPAWPRCRCRPSCPIGRRPLPLRRSSRSGCSGCSGCDRVDESWHVHGRGGARWRRLRRRAHGIRHPARRRRVDADCSAVAAVGGTGPGQEPRRCRRTLRGERPGRPACGEHGLHRPTGRPGHCGATRAAPHPPTARRALEPARHGA